MSQMYSKNSNITVFRHVPDHMKDAIISQGTQQRGLVHVELPKDIIDQLDDCDALLIVTESEEHDD